MFPGAKLIRFVPDTAGKGGMKTALHSHQVSPLTDIYNAFNNYVVNGRWRKSKAPSGTGTDQSTQTDTKNCHVFYTYSLTDPTAVPTPYLLAHNFDGTTHTIWNATTGDSLFATTSPSLPATFVNIKSRCFFCLGSGLGQITDGTSTYQIGVDPPETAATYTLSGASTYTGVWTLTGSPFISKNSPSPAWTNADVGKTISLDGTQFKINAFASTFTASGTATTATGSYTATISAAWPLNGAYGGLTLTIGGDSAVIGSYSVSGSTTTVTFQTTFASNNSSASYTLSGSRFTLSANSVETTWAGTAVVYRGALTWAGAGPQYAYAWVDPVTGHVSNVSPITYVTEQDQGGVTVNLANIDTSAQPRFYATRLFRTLLNGGSVLYQLTGGTNQPSDLGYVYYGYFTNGSSIVNNHAPINGNVSVTNGSPNVTWTGAGTPFVAQQVGETADIGGVNYTVLSVTDSTHLVLTGNYAGTTGTKVYTSVLSSPSRYNIDKATGYTFGTNFSAFIGDAVAIDVSGSVQSETISNGSTLYMTILPTLWANPTGYYWFAVATGAGTLSFTDIYDDSYLNPNIIGPQNTNFPPTIDDANAYPAHMAYWDGRVWLNPTQAPAFVLFSADRVQAPVGVSEESFPFTNVLTIPAADGRVVGMKVIGPYLVITTERFAYYVAGYNESNYRLVRFATTMYGVGDLQMDELPADTGDSSNVVYLGRDKKLYVLAPGTGAISLSEPISDQISNGITTVADYAACRVHVAHIEQRRLAFLRIPGQCLCYDLERKVWTQFTPNGIIPQSFTTLYGGSRPVTEIYGYAGGLFIWQNEDASTATTLATLSTFSSGFTDTKGKKRLNYIRLYVSSNDPAKPWKATVAVDDVFGAADASVYNLDVLTYTATVETGPTETNSDNIYSLYPTNATPVDGANAKELIAFPPRAVQGNGSSAIYQTIEGFRFYIVIHFPEDTVNRDLFAFDVCISELQDDRSVEP